MGNTKAYFHWTTENKTRLQNVSLFFKPNFTVVQLTWTVKKYDLYKDYILDVCLAVELFVHGWLPPHFRSGVISHGKITANHPKSRQHPEVLRNLALLQIYIYALIQLFSRLNDCPEFDHKDQDCSHYVGHKHNICQQTPQTMVRPEQEMLGIQLNVW